MKKALSLILSLFLIFSLIPGNITVLAASTGSCGDNMTWEYRNGLITISGSGEMKNYSYKTGLGGVYRTDAPWANIAREIIIGDGVERIGESAFYGCEITSVTLSGSVRSIGKNAFFGCKKLKFNEYDNGLYLGTADNPYFAFIEPKDKNATSCIINDKTKVISDYACWYFKSLASLTLPDGLEYIGTYAFYECVGLKNLTVPGSVKTIGEHSFGNCTGLNQINIGKGVKEILVCAFSGCSGVAEVIVPEGVTHLGDSAFGSCKGLEFLVLPDSAVDLGRYIISPSYNTTICGNKGSAAESYAAKNKMPFLTKKPPVLYWELNGTVLHISGEAEMHDYTSNDSRLGKCTNAPWGNKVETVIIDEGVKSIGQNAFRGMTRLTEISLPDSVKSIGDGSFGGCTALKTVNFPDSLEKIGKKAFEDCTSLEITTLPRKLKTIDDGAFINCTAINKTVIPDGVTTIGKNAFDGCTGLTGIVIGKNVATIDNYAFADCTALYHITVPDRVTSVGEYAFSGCTSLVSLTLGSGIANIGRYAFKGCESLLYFDIPSKITTLENGLFCGCKSLMSVTLNDNITAIGDDIFNSCVSLTEITLPENLKTIGGNAFIGCTGLVYLKIPKSVTKIGGHAFEGCTGLRALWVTTFNVGLSTGAFDKCDNLIIYTSDGNLEAYARNKIDIIPTSYNCGDKLYYHVSAEGELTISGTGDMWQIFAPTYDESTGQYSIMAPWWALEIKSLKIEKTVGELCIPAFWGLMDLESITVESGNALYRSEGNCLIKGKELLLGCKESTIPSNGSVTSISTGAFIWQTYLDEITVPAAVKSIETGAFPGGVIIFGEKESTAESYAKDNRLYFVATTDKCGDNLTYTFVNGNLSVTGTGDMWDYIYDHNDITGETYSTAPWGAGVRTLKIGKGVGKISVAAFAGLPELESITVESGNALYHSAGNCLIETKTKTLILGCKNSIIPKNGSVTAIGEGAFLGTVGLTEIIIPGTIVSIGSGAFSLCIGLEEMNIPGSVTAIGDHAFYACMGLKNVTVGGGIDTLGNMVFGMCYGLKNVTLSEGVKKITDSAFYGCTGLMGVDLPDSLTEIGQYAFASCVGLDRINISRNVTSIDKTAFAGDFLLFRGKSGSEADRFAVDNGMFFYEIKTVTGDATGDETVDTADASAILRYILREGKVEKENSDSNTDGNIDTADASAILRYILREYTFPE